MKAFRAMLAAIALTLHMSTPFAGAPVSALSAGFQGAFDFRVTDSVALQATLRLPEGRGPFPLVVLMHGGDGVTEADTRLAADLTAHGYATAVVDSFTGRGFKPENGTGAGASLRPPARVGDAYAALKVLATHPQIDKQRAALFGRSHGGTSTMIAATNWAKSRYSQDNAAFKAAIALFPPCSITYPEFDSLAVPLRLHLGAKDDLTPAKACEDIAARMQAHGQNAKYTEYEEAYHAFDVDGSVAYFAQWLNYGSCNLQLPSVDAALPMDDIRRCVRRGASMGGNPQAAALFRENVVKELADLLRQP